MADFSSIMLGAGYNRMYSVWSLSQSGVDQLGALLMAEGNDIYKASQSSLSNTTANDWCFCVTAYPFQVETVGYNLELDIGNRETNILVGPLLYDTFVICANYNTRRFNKFYYYGDYTNLELFLPFIGYVDVDMYSIRNSYLHIILSIDYISGTATFTLTKTSEEMELPEFPIRIGDPTAYLISNHNIVSQHVVNLGVKIPLTRTNADDNLRNLYDVYYAASAKTIKGAVTGAVTGAVAGSKLGVPGAVAGGLLGAATSLLGVAPEVQKAEREKNVIRASGNLLSSVEFSGITHKIPHFRITRSTPVVDDDTSSYLTYLHIKGAPLCEYVRSLEGFVGSGYTELSDCHINGGVITRATEPELDELNSLLHSGIIL